MIVWMSLEGPDGRSIQRRAFCKAVGPTTEAGYPTTMLLCVGRLSTNARPSPQARAEFLEMLIGRFIHSTIQLII